MNRKRNTPKTAALTKIEALVLAASLLAASACSRAPKVAVQKYNIILFAVDTLRADHIGCYGYGSADTPHIDAFAEDSLFFQNAFCPIPKTSASFASMLTGLHPFIHKTKPNRDALDAKFLTLAELLGGQGYRTAAIVDNANLSSAFAFNQGFDSYTEAWKHARTKEQSTPFITGKVVEFLNDPGPKPFFLWVNYIEPHAPYLPPARFVRPSRPGRDIRQVKHSLITRRVLREMEKNRNFDENYY
jgi:arylsulfatase